MTQQAAISLGVGFAVLAADELDSAARVCADVMLGSPNSAADVEQFARACDVVTFDHEQVPPAVMAALEDVPAQVHPSASALIFAQDKIEMRRALTEAGIPCPPWLVWSPDTTAAQIGETLGWPVVVKTSRGGYDGRGVWVVAHMDELLERVTKDPPPGAQWLLEAYVPFVAELAAQVARSPHGQAVAYPIVETVQTNGICTQVIAPAPNLPDDIAVQAQQTALQIAGLFSVTGMLAVEMFWTGSELFVNELAMRPHNSGHWSIEGAVTSQFENHVRAVLDLPLGDPTALAQWTVMVNILGGELPHLYPAYRHVFARDPKLHVHLYGKSVRPGRKIGHVTVMGDDLDDLLTRAHHAADYFTGVIDE